MNAFVARADYSNTVMSYNPVAYWPLNDGPRGEVALNPGIAVPAFDVYSSGIVTSGVPGAIVADTNTAIAFDGSTGYLIVPFQAALSLAAPFSIEGWFKPHGSFPGCVCSCGDFGSRRSGWVVYYDPPFGWNFRLHHRNSPAPSLSIEGGDTAVGVWHHLMAVYDGTNGWLYVDGSLAAGPAAADNFTPNRHGAFTIGTRGDNVFPFDASADEVAIYSNALSASVVQSHYQNARDHSPSVSYASLIHSQHPLLYCRLNETTSRPADVTKSSTEPSIDAESTAIDSQLQKLRTAFNYGSFGAAINGIYFGGTRPTLTGPPFPGFGSASYACQFAQFSSGYIDCTANTGLNITGPMTAIAWIKAEPGANRFQTFLGRNDRSWRASVDGYGTMRWAAGNTNPDAVGKSRVDDGTWHFFAGVYDGARNYVYVDGKLGGTVNAPAPIAGSNGKTVIGTVEDYPRDRAFQGSVAQVAIFTNALSAADILRIYDSAEPTPSIEK